VYQDQDPEIVIGDEGFPEVTVSIQDVRKNGALTPWWWYAGAGVALLLLLGSAK
jgi:hypothetical protein